MAKMKVMTVEVGLYNRMVPLLGGYLEAYAYRDPWLKSSYIFEKYTATPRMDYKLFLRDLADSRADIYAFSCYVWNIRLVMKALQALVERSPSCRVILGGPQIMHNADRYLSVDLGNIAVCNGEGEVTFADYLRELTESSPDLRKVAGLSFNSDRTLVTNPDRPRIKLLDDIPSPFLSGLFTSQYSLAIIETTRGCPFSCSFCYWGAATNDRVYRFSEERIKDEMTWISKAAIPFEYIADANWGMLPRDISLTQHLADCKRACETPQMVYYSAAKNRPDRVTAITEILRSAEIMVAQPISMQTLNADALRFAQRENIKTSAYVELQARMTEQNISSFTELIWPLPGETSSSFRAGIQQLCRAGNSVLIVYPHYLLVNTPLFKDREKHNLVTRNIDDESSDAEVVVSTRETSQEDFEDGLRHFYAVHLLHNARALYRVAAYLDRENLMNYSSLFDAFASWWRQKPDLVMSQIIEKAVRSIGCYDLGLLIHYALDSCRESFAELVDGFISSQACYADERVRFLHAMDKVLMPYIYSSTTMGVFPRCSGSLEVEQVAERHYEISIAEAVRGLFSEWVPISGDQPEIRSRRYLINHSKEQYPFMKSEGLEHNAAYCHGMILRIESIMPTCTPI